MMSKDQNLRSAVALHGDHDLSWRGVSQYMQHVASANNSIEVLKRISSLECQLRWRDIVLNDAHTQSLEQYSNHPAFTHLHIQTNNFNINNSSQLQNEQKPDSISNGDAAAETIVSSTGVATTSMVSHCEASAPISSAGSSSPTAGSNNHYNLCGFVWTEEEQNQLSKMVDDALHSETVLDYTKMVSLGTDKIRTISWINIAKALNRSSDEINFVWSKMRLAKFKRGSYSAEEDRLIITRVREWYSQPEEIRPKSGLWVSLERELNREDKRISERWRVVLSKRVSFKIQEPLSARSFLNESATRISSNKRQRTDCSVPPTPSDPNHNLSHFSLPQISSGGSLNHTGSMPPLYDSNNNYPSHASISIDSFEDLQHLQPHQHLMHHDLSGQQQFLGGMSHSNSNININMNQPQDQPQQDIRGGMIPLVDDNQVTTFEVLTKPESVRWNDEMDRLLREAIRLHGNNWDKIATYVNNHTDVPKGRVDDAKCRGRYYRVLRKVNNNSTSTSGNN